MTEAEGKTPNYELRWIIIGLLGLAVLLALSFWRMFSSPGRIPTNPTTASIHRILKEKMFRHPGVVKLGPHHYRVAVIAKQFQFEPNKIVVPTNARIDFYVTSADVVHGFEMPGTDVNVEVLPGYVAHVFSRFHTPHDYIVACDQYCGIGHQNMIGEFNVVSHLPAKGSASSSGSGTVSLQKLGAKVYANHCAACHQGNGQGRGSAFPPLAGSIPEYERSASRQAALIDVMLYGLKGPIKAGGKSYNGNMPAWGNQLNDRQIAGVLAYIAHAWGNAGKEPANYKPISPKAIKAQRGKKMTATKVHAARAAALGNGK